jgi:hypothetical protein
MRFIKSSLDLSFSIDLGFPLGVSGRDHSLDWAHSPLPPAQLLANNDAALPQAMNTGGGLFFQKTFRILPSVYPRHGRHEAGHDDDHG